MKSLLFALGLALCCFVQANQDQRFEDMDVSQYLGRWVNMAIACNSSEAVEHIKNMTAFVSDVARLEEDLYSVSVLFPLSGECHNVTCQIRKGKDGSYHGFPDDTEVTVESKKLRDEVFMSTIKDDQNDRVTVLHSRTETQDEDILREFEEECLRLGYSKDQIVILKPDVMCK